MEKAFSSFSSFFLFLFFFSILFFVQWPRKMKFRIVCWIVIVLLTLNNIMRWYRRNINTNFCFYEQRSLSKEQLHLSFPFVFSIFFFFLVLMLLMLLLLLFHLSVRSQNFIYPNWLRIDFEQCLNLSSKCMQSYRCWQLTTDDWYWQLRIESWLLFQ